LTLKGWRKYIALTRAEEGDAALARTTGRGGVMNRRQLWVVLAVAAVVAYGHAPAAGDSKVLGGVEIGAVAPLAPFDRFSTTGGSFSPYSAYMLNGIIGGMGQLHILGLPNKDRPGVLDDDATWVFGATAGPRLVLPFGDLEAYGTWQGGIYTGLAPNSSVTDTSWGFSTGGGASWPLWRDLRLGGFCKYNRLYQRVHGRGDARFVTAGLNLEYNFSAAPPPAPSPPPVAKAEPTPAPTPVAKKIVLRGVNFDFDKSNIRADARPILDEAVSTLKAEGGVVIVSEGHTDSRGTEEYNLALSRRRAQAVKDYLVAGGIAADRIKVEGFGESKPVASNETEDGRAQNRRVELRIAGE
jgi:outer membrane protein OmpA-like peptidoglycan-associated protein